MHNRKSKKNHINKYKDNSKNLEPDRFYAQAEFDYHDRGILHPYDIESLLNEFLEESYLKNLRQVLVIVGKGNVVRPLVDKLLKGHIYVESYSRAGYFNGQDGAFEVKLKV